MTHYPRKRFGQNFLHDEHVIERIINAIDPQPGEHIVEIGPGKGALTQPLLAAVGHLDVVELDRDLIVELEKKFTPGSGLTMHSADALKFDFSSLLSDHRPLRIVGNLPYNISTPLIFHLLDFATKVQDMHFMLQKEVVERMAASPGSKEYGRLSVMVQYYCKVEQLFLVSPGAFSPVPKVNSAIVRLTPYQLPPVPVNSVHTLSKLVTAAFAHRRKTLRNNLKGLLSAEEIQAIGIDPGLRAEMLSLEDFARLSNLLREQ